MLICAVTCFFANQGGEELHRPGYFKQYNEVKLLSKIYKNIKLYVLG